MPIHNSNRHNSNRGIFITLEGIDGAGKSTHSQWLVELIKQNGFEVIHTREPGGTELSEELRGILLNREMRPLTEALLMFAARHDHVETIINPALSSGVWVVCDRFTDASYAYQGGGRGVSESTIHTLENITHPHLNPDLTFLFDLPLSVAKQRRSVDRSPDRFEHEQELFFIKTRNAYLERAAQFPERFFIVDSEKSINLIRKDIERKLSELIKSIRA